MDRRLLLTGAALAAATPAFAQDAASMAERFAATLSAHDMTAFAALFADDYVNHQQSAAAPAPSGKTPKQASMDFFAARLVGLPDLNCAIESMVASGDKFAASFVWTGTQKGPLFGVAPTGRTLRFGSCDIFRIANGLIVEHWGMGDIAGVLAQIRS